jgi:prepilin-type processing-associated H-X9-DG protein
MYRPRHYNGFSLVETLVAVSTTTLLVGLLLPSLQTVRQQAQRTLCLSNLRQMTVAAQSYSSVYDGHYPLAYCNRREGTVPYFYAWDFTTWKDWSDVTNPNRVQAGLLWMGRAIEKVHQCPGFSGADNSLADPYTGYNYNTSYIGLNDLLSPANSAQATDVRRPSETALFGDGQCTDGGANKYMRAPFAHPGDTLLPDSARHAGAQGYRHLQQTNVAFCDGHAQSWRQVHTETDPAAREVLDSHNVTSDIQIGFLSANNEIYDLK